MRIDLSHLRQFLLKQCFKAVDRKINRQSDPDHAYRIPFAVVDHTADLMVVEDLDIFGAVDDLRRAHADLQHFSFEVTDLDDVADTECSLKDYTQACQDIRHNIFGSQRDGQRQQTDGRQKCLGIDSQKTQRHTYRPYEHGIV